MLTVKHITLRGEEFIYATSHVNYVPGPAKGEHSSSNPIPHDSVWIYEGHTERARELTGGTVFVMNEKGSTVSRYDIGASSVPIGSGFGISGPEDPGAALVGSRLGRVAA